MAKENKALGREVGFCNPGLSSVLDNFLSEDVPLLNLIRTLLNSDIH